MSQNFESNFRVKLFDIVRYKLCQTPISDMKSSFEVSQCNSFVYNRGALSNFTTISGGQWETAVTELDLVCTDSWKNTLITVSTFIGFMLGSIVGGNYCDNFGRKNGITVFSFLLGTTLIIHGVVPVNYWVFAILRILESLFLCTVHKPNICSIFN